MMVLACQPGVQAAGSEDAHE
eukprot:COSAG02_NODE_22723_length_742_cov_0.805599_1_plen_20_part_01